LFIHISNLCDIIKDQAEKKPAICEDKTIPIIPASYIVNFAQQNGTLREALLSTSGNQ